jgi:uncharacterized repeat protein (TIGR03803 family)
MQLSAIEIGSRSVKLIWWKSVSAIALLVATASTAALAQTYQTIVNNPGPNGQPDAGLVQGTDGYLYGMMVSPHGTLFRTSVNGGLTTLYPFCAKAPCTDGTNVNGVIQATDGNFYGTARYGGTGTYCSSYCGTVFKITPGGAFSKLHDFCSEHPCLDGGNPLAGLIQGTDGNFYGTTSVGGTMGHGTAFRITPGGALTTLYDFCSELDCHDGANPRAPLVQATDGNFYGTTGNDGTGAYCGGYCGTVFQMTPTGDLKTLYSFCAESGCRDGAYPVAGLVQASDGYLYGTTEYGGANGGYGTVFRISTDGELTTLYSFCHESGCTDGNWPTAPLIQATNGNLYGLTYRGGSADLGTIFGTSTEGELTTLHSFSHASTNGSNPLAPLVQDTNGILYGTTQLGEGTSVLGTVYSLSLGLGPFVTVEPKSGKVGSAVTIRGTNLTGATSVTFHGTRAAFKVVSASEITTTVPTGASTGTITVVTPSGTLSSNVPFQIP